MFADSAKRTMMPNRDKWVICFLRYRSVHVPDSGERNPLGVARVSQTRSAVLMTATAVPSYIATENQVVAVVSPSERICLL